ncbi:histone-lysine N-methyltransferase SETMAR-like [Oratosquilla oratoria]|uniref:histone-lysine N-methyltransferase SETMAR-like n=1 Tax=Oratosquilla oratoria TaxID=337810 RepID=UPI003F75B5B1
MEVSTDLVRGYLLYDFKVGLSAAASSRRICQAFGDSAVNEHTARRWFKRFKSGDLSLRDEPRSGRSQVLNDGVLKVTIEEDSSLTCDDLARQFNVSDETVRLHLHRLGKTFKLSKWVPHTLLEVHKRQRVAACILLLFRHRTASLFNRVLTSDEKWVLYETPKRSRHWLSPQDAVPHTTRPPMYPRKIMLYVWWTGRQVVHYELLPTGQTVTGDLYSQQLKRVQQALSQKKQRTTPGRMSREWKSFTNEADLRQALTEFFASKTPEFYRKGIEQLETHWQKVLDADGDYFED